MTTTQGDPTSRCHRITISQRTTNGSLFNSQSPAAVPAHVSVYPPTISHVTGHRVGRARGRPASLPAFTVRRPPSAARLPPSAARRPPSAVRRLPSAVCRPPSTARRRPGSARRRRWCVFRHERGRPTAVKGRPSGDSSVVSQKARRPPRQPAVAGTSHGLVTAAAAGRDWRDRPGASRRTVTGTTRQGTAGTARSARARRGRGKSTPGTPITVLCPTAGGVAGVAEGRAGVA